MNVKGYIAIVQGRLRANMGLMGNGEGHNGTGAAEVIAWAAAREGLTVDEYCHRAALAEATATLMPDAHAEGAEAADDKPSGTMRRAGSGERVAIKLVKA